MTVAALATAGCTSPTPEDARDEAHPVCAVSDIPGIPDTHSDTITEEMVKIVRTACATINVQKQNQFISEFPYEIRGDVGAGYFKLAESAGEEAEKKCLALNGLDNGDI